MLGECGNSRIFEILTWDPLAGSNLGCHKSDSTICSIFYEIWTNKWKAAVRNGKIYFSNSNKIKHTGECLKKSLDAKLHYIEHYNIFRVFTRFPNRHHFNSSFLLKSKLNLHRTIMQNFIVENYICTDVRRRSRKLKSFTKEKILFHFCNKKNTIVWCTE